MSALRIFAITALVCTPCFGDAVTSSINPDLVPEFKSISSKRYVSSQDAFDLLQDDTAILFVDVRDPVEVSIHGQPDMIDANVPIRVLRQAYQGAPNHDALAVNPNFIADMKQAFQAHNKSRHDMVILICGSGRRSAEAARSMEAAGFSNVWHIPDGYPGDDHQGYNAQHAWRIAGLPWRETDVDSAAWQLLLSPPEPSRKGN